MINSIHGEGYYARQDREARSDAFHDRCMAEIDEAAAQLKRGGICLSCRGSSYLDEEAGIDCPACGGTGFKTYEAMGKAGAA